MRPMKDACYLTLNRNGIKKMTKSEPALEPGEVAVKVHVEVDARHFRTHHAEARLTIGEQQLLFPDVDVFVADAEDWRRPIVDVELPG